MNAFKVTYTDGTHYTTNANGTAAEFEAYLTQAGRTICTYENPETGAETFKTIEKVEDVTEYPMIKGEGAPQYCFDLPAEPTQLALL